MITSSQQRNKVTKRISELEKQLKMPGKKGIPEIVVKSSKQQIVEDITNLKEKIFEFDSATTADISTLEISGFKGLKKLPIVIRLATKMTISEFAKAVDLNERQVRRLERSEYKMASIELFESILEKLKTHFSNLNIHGNFLINY